MSWKTVVVLLVGMVDVVLVFRDVGNAPLFDYGHRNVVDFEILGDKQHLKQFLLNHIA